MNKKTLPFLFLVSGLLFSFTLYAQTLYVSPAGNDKNPGTRGLPLASLTGARERLRALRKDKPPQDTVRVIIGGGTYTMKEPLVLEPQDGGSERYPVVYRAEEGAQPVFSGGMRLGDISVDERGYWILDIPRTGDGRRKFEQLYVNGRRAERAHSPDTGFFYMRGVTENVWVRGEGRAPQRAQQIITAGPASLQELKDLPVNDLKKVVMTVYHKWDITKRHPDGISDTAIFTSGEGMKPWNRWKKGSRYILENYKGALTKAGEWFLEDNGRLTYIPLPGEDPEKAGIIAPLLTHLIVLKGDIKHGKYVKNIRFEGLKFRYTAYYLPPGGFEPSQAAATIDAAVQADGVRNIVIKNCEIAHTGNYGVWFREDCRNCREEHCYIRDLGAGGVRMGTMKIPEDTSLITGNIILDNNIIQSGGFLFPPAVGVWIGQSGDNTVSHNDIGDFRYTGVSVGWVWGYAYSPAKRNRIVYNHIHHIGWGLLSDMGGVYTLGVSEGTEVSHNVIDHIWAYDYGGWGLYPDEGTSFIKMEKNLVYKTKTGGFHQHYGRENTIRNNIFAFAARYQLQCTRVEDHLSFRFLNNIVYFDRGVLLGGPWDKIRIEMDRNIYWNMTGEVKFLKMDFHTWKKNIGHDRHSRIADPGFADPAGGDFRLEKHQAPGKAGFVPFDYSRAGVYGSDGWKKKARLPETARRAFDKIMEGER